MEIVLPARNESLDILPELRPGFADQGTGLGNFLQAEHALFLRGHAHCC